MQPKNKDYDIKFPLRQSLQERVHKLPDNKSSMISINHDMKISPRAISIWVSIFS